MPYKKGEAPRSFLLRFNKGDDLYRALERRLPRYMSMNEAILMSIAFMVGALDDFPKDAREEFMKVWKATHDGSRIVVL